MKALLLLCLISNCAVRLPNGIGGVGAPCSGYDAARHYWKVSIARMATNKHTHVAVTGRVALVKHEGDGDLHIKVSDGNRFMVAECIPALPCSEPKIGDVITVRGISRYDGEHHWPEVHPVEKLTIQHKEQ